MTPDAPEERPQTPTLDGVLAQIEGDYFYDYAQFSGSLREYTVRALEAQYRAAPNELHKRAFMLNVYREEYTAYEDLGAFLEAFLLAKRDATAPPLLRIMTYGPGEVKITAVLERHNITNGDGLFEALGLADWIPTDWRQHHPNIDLTKVLRRACHSIVEDCGPGQKGEGVRAFNKIKHGLVLVPEARVYSRDVPSSPAIIFANHPKDSVSKEYPVSVMALPTEPHNFENRLRMIHFTQFELRMFAMLYVLKRYPEVIKKRALTADSSVFGSERMIDVLAFMEKSANVAWTKE